MTSRAPKQPCLDLFNGPREDYVRIAIPLYKASIIFDWKAVKAILDNNPEIPLVRYSITENGETPLHVAASTKLGSKKMEDFINNLVGFMNKEDLKLQNKNHNTALYLAAVAGNIEAVKIMIQEKGDGTVENKVLLAIPGDSEMMPLDAAVLFGHHKVAKYLYKYSNLSDDDVWTHEKRCWLLEKCIENDMFDIALQIVACYPEVACHGEALQIMARKHDAFDVKETNFLWRIIRMIIIPDDSVLISNMALGYKFDDDKFHALVHGTLPYHILKPDLVLRNLLLSMPQRKIIFTNADKAHAARVLSKLCLEDCFEGVICFETLNSQSLEEPQNGNDGGMNKSVIKCSAETQCIDTRLSSPSRIICKPALESFQAAAIIANIDPNKTIFFDDSVRNIATAKTAGFHTVIVGRSSLVPGADHALNSIHNIKEALPELWAAKGEHLEQVFIQSAAVETFVNA